MQHGGDLTDARARHGAGEPAWLDLSTGINPHSFPVDGALARAGLETLPSRADLDTLIAAARRAYRVPDEAEIVASPGTQAIIQWLPRLAPPGAVAVAGPTYGEHAAAWQGAGRAVRDVIALGQADEAAHVILCNPNNPDGRIVSLPELHAQAERCRARGGWLVIDESFVDTCPEASAAGLVRDLPVIVLRSFGKFYGLAGLRLGFAIARPEIARQLGVALGPWAVAGPALAIGAAALADTTWADAMQVQLLAESAALDVVLHAGGLAFVGGTTLFRLARHRQAAAIHAGLAAVHIWTRIFDHAPDLIRFGLPPDAAALRRLAEALLAIRPEVQGAGQPEREPG